LFAVVTRPDKYVFVDVIAPDKYVLVEFRLEVKPELVVLITPDKYVLVDDIELLNVL